ncbi:hypothetical protein JCM10212_006899 [Sporobolomyces blumeae]
MPNPPPPPRPAPFALPTTTSSASTSTTTPNPAPSSSVPTVPPLQKFPLHQPANASSPLITCSSSTGPLPNQTLLNLRTVLVASRFQASSRVQLKEENKRLLVERQAVERRTAEEAGRVKEGERKRKREEDERRELERVEKIEKDRKREQREQAEAKAKEEHDKMVRKAQEREENERRNGTERQKQAEVAAGSREASVAIDGDVTMHDVPPPKPTKKIPSKAVPSPEPEDDADQPKPPRLDKKKRKRDHIVDSDDSGSDDAAEQPLLQKLRKTDSHQPSPSIPPTPTQDPLALADGDPPLDSRPIAETRPNPVEQKLQEDRFTKHSIPIKPPAPGAATAFYVPSYPLVPPKPPVVPPVPTPKRQADVSGDFSTAKPGQQIAHSTFTNWTEAYLRPFGEDDLAFLAAKPEDLTPYVIPPLGKPYLQRWEEEDLDSSHLHASTSSSSLKPHAAPSSSSSRYPSPLEIRPVGRVRPEHLNEDAMGTEHVALGPVSERLMSALAFEEGAKFLYADRSDDDSDGDEEEGDGERNDVDCEGPGTRRDRVEAVGSCEIERDLVPAKRVDLDAYDLEERIKRELRFIGLLPDEEIDWSSREDDEISTSLRACQRLLQHQVDLNESRKAILMSLVKDRMAYQEYETARDAQERVIEAGWHKRQRTDNKKKKKGSTKDRDRRGGGQSAADGDDPSKVPVSATLMEAVEKRNALVECFRPFFDDDGDKSRWWGIPERSVYRALDEAGEGDEDGEPDTG